MGYNQFDDDMYDADGGGGNNNMKNNPMLDEVPETTVGANVTMSGNLSFERLLRIDGTFTGSLSSEGDLVIGPDGALNGDVIGLNEVLLDGVIRGNVEVQRVELRGTAQIYGNVSAKVFTMEPGTSVVGKLNVHNKAPLFINSEEEIVLEDETATEIVGKALAQDAAADKAAADAADALVQAEMAAQMAPEGAPEAEAEAEAAAAAEAEAAAAAEAEAAAAAEEAELKPTKPEGDAKTASLKKSKSKKGLKDKKGKGDESGAETEDDMEKTSSKKKKKKGKGDESGAETEDDLDEKTSSKKKKK
jgi:cytoskeletal protein CcmA (bactofilin family)